MARTETRSGKGNRAVTIVIRRSEDGAAGHHGGAWKVAYADFVTAMMAFFLLMWLLNATTEEQRRGLADYFSPTNEMSRAHDGAGLAFGGRTAFENGALASDRGAVRVLDGPVPAPDVEDDDSDTPAQPLVYHRAPPAPGKSTTPAEQAGAAKAGPEAVAAEQAGFAAAAQTIRDAVRADPALAAVADQLKTDQTPQGLRIQLLDRERQPMFATGSADPNPRARLLLAKVGPVLARMTEPVTIAGHTDAAPYPGPGRTNWDLSADRANATRRLLTASGLPDARFRSVIGRADRDLLLPATPLAAANRRIAIIVLRTAGEPAPAAAPGPGSASAPAAPSPPADAAVIVSVPQ